MKKAARPRAALFCRRPRKLFERVFQHQRRVAFRQRIGIVAIRHRLAAHRVVVVFLVEQVVDRRAQGPRAAAVRELEIGDRIAPGFSRPACWPRRCPCTARRRKPPSRSSRVCGLIVHGRAEIELVPRHQRHGFAGDVTWSARQTAARELALKKPRIGIGVGSAKRQRCRAPASVPSSSRPRRRDGGRLVLPIPVVNGSRWISSLDVDA